MKILVALITPNSLAGAKFKKNFISYLRAGDVHETFEFSPDFVAAIIDASLSDFEAEEELLELSKDVDAIAVILDSASDVRLTAITNGLFIHRVSLGHRIANVQNTLLPITSRLVKSFSFLLAKFHRSEQFAAAAVPMRNFDADEARYLSRLFANLTLEGNFTNDLSTQVAKLSARRKPSISRFPEQSLVDDKGKYFKYGHEAHSKIATGAPHLTSCELNGRFRFGKRLPDQRHFNVFYPNERISGDFPDCHDALQSVKNATHVNIFSSDHQP